MLFNYGDDVVTHDAGLLKQDERFVLPKYLISFKRFFSKLAISHPLFLRFLPVNYQSVRPKWSVFCIMSEWNTLTFKQWD